MALVVEHLETMKASGKCNYEYVVLQATDNSIPFYESMGFKRVGAVMQDNVLSDQQKSASNDDGDDDDDHSNDNNDIDDGDDLVAEPVDENSPERPNAIARTNDIVSSEVISYTTEKPGENPKDIAKKFNVDVWDIIFLNKDIYPDLMSCSRLLAGTVLHIPVYPKPPNHNTKRGAALQAPQWYTAKEDETPRIIAKKFKVNCLDLVNANKERLPGLLSGSRLKAGTRIKVSHLDVIEYDFKPYAHWSFPDDKFEEGEPSYMMAKKLNRRRGTAAKYKPFQASLGTTITAYEPPTLLLPSSPVATAPRPTLAPPIEPATSSRKSKQRHPNEPKPPKRPLCAYMLFAAEQRERRKADIVGMHIGQAAKYFKTLWDKLSDDAKQKYERMSLKSRERYQKDRAVYDKKMEAFRANYPELDDPIAPLPVEDDPVAIVRSHQSLYNKVVRLKPGAVTDDSEYKYWYVVCGFVDVTAERLGHVALVESCLNYWSFRVRYVLTFIPDLKWCHLAPMIQVGVFGPDKPKSEGKPKWKLVDEELGKEVDISSSFCIPIKSKSMKRTLDADKEEWDIIDDGSEPFEESTAQDSNSSRNSVSSVETALSKRVSRARQQASKATRIHRNAEQMLPRLVARYPGERHDVFIELKGTRLRDPTFDYPEEPKDLTSKHATQESTGTPKRGRPKGSKNKPKTPDSKVLAAKVKSPVGRPKGSKNKPKSPVSDVSPQSTGVKVASSVKSAHSKTPPKSPVSVVKSRPSGRRLRSAELLDDEASTISNDVALATSSKFVSKTGSVKKTCQTRRSFEPEFDDLSSEDESVHSSSLSDTSDDEDDGDVAESELVVKSTHRVTRSSMARMSPENTLLTDLLTNLPDPGRTRRLTRIQEKLIFADNPSTTHVRPKRKAAAVACLSDAPRKRRKVNHVGSRRAVL